MMLNEIQTGPAVPYGQQASHKGRVCTPISPAPGGRHDQVIVQYADGAFGVCSALTLSVVA